jgi:hypothetical protein
VAASTASASLNARTSERYYKPLLPTNTITHDSRTQHTQAPNLVNSPFHWSTEVNTQKPFCLQCCNNVRDTRMFRETWNLKCENDMPAASTDLFNYELRFARNKFQGDQAVIRCKVPRRRDVQQIKITSPPGSVAGGFFQLGFAGNASMQWTANISHRAVAEEWEEYPLKTGDTDPGEGRGESMYKKVPLLFALTTVEPTPPIPIPIRIVRCDCDTCPDCTSRARVYRVRSRGQVTDMLAVVTGTYNVRMSMLTGAGSPDFGPIDVR